MFSGMLCAIEMMPLPFNLYADRVSRKLEENQDNLLWHSLVSMRISYMQIVCVLLTWGFLFLVVWTLELFFCAGKQLKV